MKVLGIYQSTYTFGWAGGLSEPIHNFPIHLSPAHPTPLRVRNCLREYYILIIIFSEIIGIVMAYGSAQVMYVGTLNTIY